MGDIPADGKIRLRCTGCGKRVKFPAAQEGLVSDSVNSTPRLEAAT